MCFPTSAEFYPFFSLTACLQRQIRNASEAEMNAILNSVSRSPNHEAATATPPGATVMMSLASIVFSDYFMVEHPGITDHSAEIMPTYL